VWSTIKQKQQKWSGSQDQFKTAAHLLVIIVPTTGQFQDESSQTINCIGTDNEKVAN